MDSGVTVRRLRDAARALSSLDDRAALKAIQAAQNALDAAKADRLASLEESKAFELDGASSITTWARNELRLDALGTRKLTRAAATMRDLPDVGDAAQNGRIRLEHVAVFSHGLKHIDNGVVRDSVPWLLDVATTCEPVELRRVMRALREAIYPDSLDDAWEKGMDKEDFQVNAVPQGWHVNGFLNTVTGAKLKILLDSLGAPKNKDDARPGAERRVDALDTVLTSILESGLPSDKGVRPQLSVVVGVDALKDVPGARPAQLVGFGSIGPKLLGYLGCLSDLTPIVTADGEHVQANILNLGRTSRLASLKQRRAIMARQEGECAAPGCRNTHLEIHHVTWYSNGGRTDLDDMVGLCVRCHHLVHRDLLHVAADGRGHFTFSRHDNRALRNEYKRRVAIHREIGRINKTRHHVETRHRQRTAPLRT